MDHTQGMSDAKCLHFDYFCDKNAQQIKYILQPNQCNTCLLDIKAKDLASIR